MVQKRSTNRARVHRVALLMSFSTIPASALLGLPHDGSVADLLEALSQLLVEHAIEFHERELQQQRK
jgi:hypothetical protein